MFINRHFNLTLVAWHFIMVMTNPNSLLEGGGFSHTPCKVCRCSRFPHVLLHKKLADSPSSSVNPNTPVDGLAELVTQPAREIGSSIREELQSGRSRTYEPPVSTEKISDHHSESVGYVDLSKKLS